MHIQPMWWAASRATTVTALRMGGAAKKWPFWLRDIPRMGTTPSCSTSAANPATGSAPWHSTRIRTLNESRTGSRSGPAFLWKSSAIPRKQAYHTRVSSVKVASEAIVSKDVSGRIEWYGSMIGKREVWCPHLFENGSDRSLELRGQRHGRRWKVSSFITPNESRGAGSGIITASRVDPASLLCCWAWQAKSSGDITTR